MTGDALSSAVGTHRVVVHTPLLDQDLGLRQRVERLVGQKLVAELAVEAFHIPVLSRTARLDICQPGTKLGDPRLDRRGHELRPVVRADVARRAAEP